MNPAHAKFNGARDERGRRIGPAKRGPPSLPVPSFASPCSSAAIRMQVCLERNLKIRPRDGARG